MTIQTNDSNRFVSEYATIIKPPCVTCKHRSKTALRYCVAFPSGKGIPSDILTGKSQHDAPYPGDHGIQYEALEV